eukprot:CAMPEP_0201506632 /NCGR_PEP_ID=MMETSP0161_2-20130828/528_1 /ASSEMBLY_ACC=CAM_ASM_000251 /TAXON_ID=180227 /ORGANISM="Neoparamoeba aestuarina, Strain SoJaBio B1-5/56/2" /LENGTH=323 /DNA_ID=CAMNT_0047900787 /DNA_START=29 /DNA_END=1000 /DNA_ORIENTATION=+
MKEIIERTVAPRGKCAGCNKEIEIIPGVKEPLTTWKKGCEWHRPCWYGKLPDFVCQVCDERFPSSESGKFREHWLKAHLEKEDVGDTLMYLPDGMINDRNYEQVLKENAILKPARLKCLETCVEYLDSLGVEYFLSDGTLLGAFRDGGKMIDCDIDCDVSIMEKDMGKVLDNAGQLPPGYLMDTISGGHNWLGNAHLPFDPNMGVGAKKLTLVDVRDYSDVVVETMCPEVDIYTFREEEVEGGQIQLRNNYAKPNQAVHLRRWNKEWIFPLKRITFEGREYWGPNEPEKYLTELYGYIGYNAFWNPHTMKYEPKPTEENGKQE